MGRDQGPARRPTSSRPSHMVLEAMATPPRPRTRGWRTDGQGPSTQQEANAGSSKTLYWGTAGGRGRGGPRSPQASPQPSGRLPRARWPGWLPKALPMGCGHPGLGLQVHVQACSSGGPRGVQGTGPAGGGLRAASDEGGVVRAGFGLGGEVWCGGPAGLWPPGAHPHPWSPAAWARGRASDQVHVDDRVDWEASAAVGPASWHTEKREAVTITPRPADPRRRPHPPALATGGIPQMPKCIRRLATSDLSLGRGQGSADRQPQATSPSGPLHVHVAEVLADATVWGRSQAEGDMGMSRAGKAEAGAPVLGVQGPGSVPWHLGSPCSSQEYPGLPVPCPHPVCARPVRVLQKLFSTWALPPSSRPSRWRHLAGRGC